MRKLMDIKQFAEYVRKSVAGQLPVELEGAELKILYDDAKVRLQLIRPWSKITPCYRLDDAYMAYLSGNTTVEAVIAGIINNRSLYHDPLDTDGLYLADYSFARDRISRRLISSKTPGARYLKDHPHRQLAGTSIIIVWEIYLNDRYYGQNTSATVDVTWEMLRSWGISMEELDQVAARNAPRLHPASIKDMGQIFSEMGLPNGGFAASDMLVVSNAEVCNGAIAVTYPGVRERLMEILHDDFYILPSSVHECIIVAKGEYSPADLFRMVCDVNKREVEKSDFLADDVLEYAPDGRLVSALHRLPYAKSDGNSRFK